MSIDTAPPIENLTLRGQLPSVPTKLDDEDVSAFQKFGHNSIVALTSASEALSDLFGSMSLSAFLARLVSKVAFLGHEFFNCTLPSFYEKLTSFTDVVSATRIYMFPGYLVLGGLKRDWDNSRIGQIVAKIFYAIDDAISHLLFLKPALSTKEVWSYKEYKLKLEELGPIASGIGALFSLIDNVKHLAAKKWSEVEWRDIFSPVADGAFLIMSFIVTARLEARITLSALLALASGSILLSCLIPSNT